MKRTFWMLVLVAFAPNAGAQPLKQNPSPMVEHTRAHPRLKEDRPAGTRTALKIGTLFVPDGLPKDAPLLLHFHGAPWIAEIAATKVPAAVVAVQLGAGSGTYAKPFADPKAFADLLSEAEAKTGRKFERIGLTAWSAGYGAVRAILETPAHYDRIEAVLLLDALHAGYKNGKPGPRESELVEADLAVFVKLAKDAAAGKKQFLVTHTEIFPGTFASTTETADHLLNALAAKRRPVLRWGPMGTQILCEVEVGRFRLIGFAGTSAPDHVDLLHALPDLVREIRWRSAN